MKLLVAEEHKARDTMLNSGSLWDIMFICEAELNSLILPTGANIATSRRTGKTQLNIVFYIFAPVTLSLF